MGQTADQRFWLKVEKTTECWLWRAYRFPSGYGKFWADGTHDYAHRFSFRLHYGAIPDGMYVLHTCDVRHCVHPEHLFVGTQADNIHDMDAKHRRGLSRPHHIRKGIEHHAARLTAEQVVAIRASADTAIQLASHYGVSARTIRKIRQRVRWAHI
jgi:hypothetical protein